MTIAALDLQDGRRTYGPVVAVDKVSLTAANSESVTLLGPSGSGKTSTLRLVRGVNSCHLRAGDHVDVGWRTRDMQVHR